MSKTEVLVRPAAPGDTAEVQALCSGLDPADYVAANWPLWLTTARGISLVAEVGGRVVGCVYGEPIATGEAWAQALRVHADAHRRGIGSRLLSALLARLREQGVDVVRGTVHGGNSASQTLLFKDRWTLVGRIRRRRAAVRPSPGMEPPTAGRELRRATQAEATALLRSAPVLASRFHRARFRRVYFRMTEAHLAELVERAAIVVASGGQDYAVLDPDGPASQGAVWVAAIADSGAAPELLTAISVEASRLQCGVVVDGSPEIAIQSVLDAMGFEPPDPDGEFVLFERQLRP